MAVTATDARPLLILLVAVQVTLMAGPLPAWGTAAGVTTVAAVVTKISLRALFRAVRGFLVLAGVIVLSHALFSTEEAGVREGAILAGRLLSVVIAAAVFAEFLESDDIAKALGWYVRPFLGRRAARVVLMARLSLRSVKLLKEDVAASRSALVSRGLSVRRRPARYLALLGSNAVLHALRRADHHGHAVAARGYTDHLVRVPLRLRDSAWYWSGIGTVICLAAWIITGK